MAEALTTEPTGGALAGVGLARAAGAADIRRIHDSSARFQSALSLQREQLSEFRGAIARKKRGEALSDLLTIAGLATGGILGAGTKLGVAGGMSLGGQAGQVLGAGIGGQPAAPELAAIPTLALNLRDQQRLGDIEAESGTRLGDPAPELPEVAPPMATLPSTLRDPFSPPGLPRRRARPDVR